MNKKLLFGVILILTCVTIVVIVLIKFNVRYNKLIINSNEWNSIINNRSISTSIALEDIEFNDYSLLIDNEHSIIYYSVVNSNKKYNPSVKYVTNNKTNIVVNDSITDAKLELTDSLKIMIYNDKEYRIYNLVVTNYPILNVIYKDVNNDKKKVSIELELFDNHVDSPQRVLKSDGYLRIINENQEYSFSLIKESLGHNKRENYISIFGMEKRDEYIIKKVDNSVNNERYVWLFINNKYNGLYSLGPKEERRIDNFERNRENNK